MSWAAFRGNLKSPKTQKQPSVSTSCGRKTADHVKTGGDNNLDVVIAPYKPDVRCNSYSGPPWSSCVEIFGSMSVDKNRHMFGHLPDQRVQTGLPITYSSGKMLHAISRARSPSKADRRCMVTIDIVGEPTGLSWYEVWEAVVALASTCVRGKEKCGKANGLGLYFWDETVNEDANTLSSRPQCISPIVR